MNYQNIKYSKLLNNFSTNIKYYGFLLEAIDEE